MLKSKGSGWHPVQTCLGYALWVVIKVFAQLLVFAFLSWVRRLVDGRWISGKALWHQRVVTFDWAP